jgi:hypothetical protein
LDTGGPEWVLRFLEALSSAEQAIHHPLPPPSLLLPKLEQVEKWIAQIRLGPKGEDTLQSPAVSQHYLAWVRNGALKDKFRETQMKAKQEGEHRRKAASGRTPGDNKGISWSAAATATYGWHDYGEQAWGSWGEPASASSSHAWSDRGDASWTWHEK